MIYVYGIMNGSYVDMEGIRGLAGAPITRFPFNRIAAICSVHDRLELSRAPAELWAHHRVLSDLSHQTTVAPTRFGTAVTDASQLFRLLAAHETGLASTLSWLCGKREMALRAALDRDAPIQALVDAAEGNVGSGRRYLRELLNQSGGKSSRSLPDPLQGIHAELSRTAVASQAGMQPANEMVASYLVEEARLAEFSASVTSITERHPGIRISVTGPWVPFSFVDRPPAAFAASDVRECDV